MRYDDGIPERLPTDLELEAKNYEINREAKIRLLAESYGTKADFRKLMCENPRLTFKDAGEAERVLNARGYNVRREGIISALYRARKSGYAAVHRGLVFKHLRERQLPVYREPTKLWVIIGGKTYDGIPGAAKALKVPEWTIGNSIRRGYWTKRVIYKIRAQRENGRWMLWLNNVPYSGGVTQVSRSLHTDKVTIYNAIKTGVLKIRKRIPCHAEPKAYAVTRKAA